MKLLAFLCAGALLSFTAQAQVKKTTTHSAKTKTVNQKPVVKKPLAKTIKKSDGDLISKPVRVKITTDSGIMILKLSDSTPLHRDNFIKLVKEGFYDSLMFHRVIAGFMIQGGDPQSKYAAAGTMLGNGGGDMTRIPAEFNPALRHKRGALAAARDGNPEKASSACQFYIVDGKKLSDAEIDMWENKKGFKYTTEEKEQYKNSGGTPSLDMEYTVFGEVESGFEVIGKIANVTRDARNRPLGDVRMKIEILH